MCAECRTFPCGDLGPNKSLTEAALSHLRVFKPRPLAQSVLCYFYPPPPEVLRLFCGRSNRQAATLRSCLRLLPVIITHC